MSRDEDNVRPEILALCERGNITRAESKELRGNSWEWARVVRAMDDEAFVDMAEKALDNCGPVRHPPSTYQEAVLATFLPELLRRYKRDKRLVSEQDREHPLAKAERVGNAEAGDEFVWAKGCDPKLAPLQLHGIHEGQVHTGQAALCGVQPLSVWEYWDPDEGPRMQKAMGMKVTPARHPPKCMGCMTVARRQRLKDVTQRVADELAKDDDEG